MKSNQFPLEKEGREGEEGRWRDGEMEGGKKAGREGKKLEAPEALKTGNVDGCEHTHLARSS